MSTSLRPPPLLNRGAGAWSSSTVSPVWLTARHPDVSPVVTRAQVHAVTDDTNDSYSAVVRAALHAVDSGVRSGAWQRPSTLFELDAILAAICDEMIYVQRRGPAFGMKFHAAWAHIFPNQMNSLHAFSRACTGWHRMMPQNEGFGLKS